MDIFCMEAFHLINNIIPSRYLHNIPDPGTRKSQRVVVDDKTTWESWSLLRPPEKTSSSSSLKMVAGMEYIPKKDRGEDGHFIDVENGAVGVADGVGSWRDKGIDAGEYARELMSNCLIALKQHNKHHHQEVDPKVLLTEAFNKATAKGSSTACIVTLHGHTLRAANVGDSGFMIVRQGKVVYQSPIQQHVFNCPYQLGATRDHPKVAQLLEYQVEVGDIVVVGTDGLFDNIFATQIEQIINYCKRGPGDVANFIAHVALSNSLKKNIATPYSLNANQAGMKHRVGGKKDDITVIVAFIVKSK